MRSLSLAKKKWQKAPEKWRQWIWFIILWLGGLSAVWLLAIIIRTMFIF